MQPNKYKQQITIPIKKSNPKVLPASPSSSPLSTLDHSWSCSKARIIYMWSLASPSDLLHQSQQPAPPCLTPTPQTTLLPRGPLLHLRSAVKLPYHFSLCVCGEGGVNTGCGMSQAALHRGRDSCTMKSIFSPGIAARTDSSTESTSHVAHYARRNPQETNAGAQKEEIPPAVFSIPRLTFCFLEEKRRSNVVGGISKTQTFPPTSLPPSLSLSLTRNGRRGRCCRQEEERCWCCSRHLAEHPCAWFSSQFSISVSLCHSALCWITREVHNPWISK